MKLKSVTRQITIGNDTTFYRSKDKGEFTYFCPKCNTPNNIKIISQISVRGSEDICVCFKVFITCRNCGEMFVTCDKGIDPNISNAIIKLNKLGFKTTSSCEGHVDEHMGYVIVNPYILFENDSIIKYGHPDGWYFIYDENGTRLEYKINKYGYNNDEKINALENLYKWIDTIK